MAYPEELRDNVVELVLRDPDSGEIRALVGDEVTPELEEQATLEAKRRKAEFIHRHEGAQARAGMLGQKLTAAFAGGVVVLMLEKLLQEELVPATAKEAVEVAKASHEIYKSLVGVAAGKDLTPEERRRKEDDAHELFKTLSARAEKAAAPLSGALQPGETPAPVAVDDDENLWEDDPITEPDPT